MGPMDWAGLAVAIATLITAYVGSIRWLVKHYLDELKPNGGGSVKDQVNRLETRVDQIYLLLCEKEQFTSSILFNLWNILICHAYCSSSVCKYNSYLFRWN